MFWGCTLQRKGGCDICSSASRHWIVLVPRCCTQLPPWREGQWATSGPNNTSFVSNDCLPIIFPIQLTLNMTSYFYSSNISTSFAKPSTPVPFPLSKYLSTKPKFLTKEIAEHWPTQAWSPMTWCLSCLVEKQSALPPDYVEAQPSMMPPFQ